MGIFGYVNVSATRLAKDSKGIFDEVVHRGKSAVVSRHGRPVAEIRKTVGVTPKEFIRRMKQVRFTKAEADEMEAAMKEGTKAFGYAGGD